MEASHSRGGLATASRRANNRRSSQQQGVTLDRRLRPLPPPQLRAGVIFGLVAVVLAATIVLLHRQGRYKVGGDRSRGKRGKVGAGLELEEEGGVALCGTHTSVGNGSTVSGYQRYVGKGSGGLFTRTLILMWRFEGEVASKSLPVRKPTLDPFEKEPTSSKHVFAEFSDPAFPHHQAYKMQLAHPL